MFFTFKDCFDKHSNNFKNVLHIGAHHGEEIEEYYSVGVEYVCWFEANPECMPILIKNTNKFDKVKQTYFCNVLSDTNDEEINFNITSNGQSSSILELGSHSTYCPNIKVVNIINLKTKRMDNFVNEIDFEKFDFLTLDVQGAELKVLKGFGDIFDKYTNIKGIYTEINFEQVYIGAAHVNELDKYLTNFKFNRIKSFKFDSAPWGDAFYYRE